MSIEQLSHLSLSAVNALTHAQRSSLDRKQITAIQETAKTLGSVLNDGCCFPCRTTWSTVTLIAYSQLLTLIIQFSIDLRNLEFICASNFLENNNNIGTDKFDLSLCDANILNY